MKSVRRQLLFGSAIATVLVFAAAAVTFYWLARNFLVREIDNNLLSKAKVLGSMVEFVDDRIGLEASDLGRFPEFSGTEAPEYYQLVTDDGKRVARSPSLRAYAAHQVRGAVVGAGEFVTLPDGRPGRVVSVDVTQHLDADELFDFGGKQPVVTVSVSKATTELDRLLQRLRWLLAAVCGIGATVLLAVSAAIIRRGLRPVEQISDEIAAIDAQQLDARFAVEHAPRELRPIVDRLNELLQRLQQAFDREQAFTADAAHELRTPLAGLHTALEVCATRRREPEEYQQVVNNCLQVTRRMRGMIDNLLLLARADSAQLPARQVDVRIIELFEESIERHRPTLQERGLAVDVAMDRRLTATTDPELLCVIINNLIDNAAHYADANSEICISQAGNGDGHVAIRVSNSGSRVPPGEDERVFDRFWRADASRSAGGRRCGLGLAICRKLATKLGATITAESTVGGMFIATLCLRGKISVPNNATEHHEVPHLQARSERTRR